MAAVLQPWHILVTAMAGWITRQQGTVIEYLREENRVLKQQLAGDCAWPMTSVAVLLSVARPSVDEPSPRLPRW